MESYKSLLKKWAYAFCFKLWFCKFENRYGEVLSSFLISIGKNVLGVTLKHGYWVGNMHQAQKMRSFARQSNLEPIFSQFNFRISGHPT